MCLVIYLDNLHTPLVGNLIQFGQRSPLRIPLLELNLPQSVTHSLLKAIINYTIVLLFIYFFYFLFFYFRHLSYKTPSLILSKEQQLK